jgi:hypothetical protein
MVYLETIVDTVETWLEDNGDTDTVVKRVNKAVREVEKLNWEAMKRKVIITPDADGTFLVPPLSRAIDAIYPDYEESTVPTFEFQPNAMVTPGNEKVVKSHKYFNAEINMVALESALVVDVVQNSQTITQAVASLVDIDESWVGEQLRLPNDETLYEITGAVAATSMTVFPPVRSETYNASSCVIRPIGLTKLKVTDWTGTPYTGDIKVHYYMKHPQLIDATDMLLIPAEDTVSLETVKFFLHQTKYDVDARNLEFDLRAARAREYAQQAVTTTESVVQDTSFSLHSRNNRRNRR